MEGKHPIRRALLRALVCLGLSAAFLLAFLLGTVWIVNKGPSPAARDLLVATAMETSAAKFLATWFFSDAEIEEILSKNAVAALETVTDGELVEVAPPQEGDAEQKPMEALDVTGPTYKGKLLIVRDPSRVYVATPEAFGLPGGGMRVHEMMERDGAVAGVNGGGFQDEGGVGDGGQPTGIVIAQGKLMAGAPSATYELIGLDRENKLVVGGMTGQQALDRGIRDAVSFGPALIVNGQPAFSGGTGGGLNPRTAIGQRADGAILLLVIDGRQSHSLGATFQDLIDVMAAHGAVNAANLDGGSSSLMYLGDELVTTCASLYGPRKLPTAVLVRGEGEQ